jgi:hypothetical protein
LITKSDKDNDLDSAPEKTALRNVIESNVQDTSSDVKLENNFEGCLKNEVLNDLNISMTEDTVLDKSVNVHMNCEDSDKSVNDHMQCEDSDKSINDHMKCDDSVPNVQYSNGESKPEDLNLGTELSNGLDGSGFNSEASILCVNDSVAATQLEVTLSETSLTGSKAEVFESNDADSNDEYYTAMETSSPEKQDDDVLPSWHGKESRVCLTMNPSSDSGFFHNSACFCQL